MLVQHPIMLPREKTTLTQPSQPAAVHPLYRTLRLMICHLSGQLSLITAFHRSLVNSPCHHGRLELRDNMGPTSGIGSDSVIRGIDPISPSIADGLQFLTNLFHNGLGYSAINTARSVLSTLISLSGGITFGSHPLVCRPLKGVYAE